MGQIQDLEQRITTAFARISSGVDAMADALAAATRPTLPDPGQEALQAALDAERRANAELTERFVALHQQATDTEQDLQMQLETLTQHLDAQGLDVQRLSSTVAQLREDLRRLREAALQGVVDPGLINKAMMAELEALRTTRGAEANEMNDIMTALGGILQAEEARSHA